LPAVAANRAVIRYGRAIGVSAAGIVAAAVVLVSGVDWFATGVGRQRTESDVHLVSQPAHVPAEQASGKPRALTSATGDGSRVLADSQRKIGLETVVAAADRPGQDADSVLAGIALGHDDVAVREEAVYALGERGGSLAMQTLQQAIQDPHPRVREAAVRALADVDTNEAARILGGALTAKDAALRLDAVEALGEIGSPEAARYIEQALGDESSLVREAAAQWLAELSAERR
jgi:HEAT repeats/PBS lyase HEAT-like repeat